MAIDRQRIYHKRHRVKQLRAFCHASRLESITRSAEYLGVSQPAVSLHVRELEHEMEAVLFERSGPHITLTSAGECLYRFAMPLLEATDRLFDTFTKQVREFAEDDVRIAGGPSAVAYVLPPLLKRFRDENPDIRLHVQNRMITEGLKLLSANKVDFVVSTERPETTTFSYHPMFSFDFVLITPEDHPLAGHDSVDIEEAVQYPVIMPSDGTYNREFVEAFAHRRGIELDVAVETRGWVVIKHCVEAGLGVALVPNLCLTGKERVRVIPFTESSNIKVHTDSLSYGIFTQRDRPLSPSARRLIQMMAPDFRDPPAP